MAGMFHPHNFSNFRLSYFTFHHFREEEVVGRSSPWKKNPKMFPKDFLTTQISPQKAPKFPGDESRHLSFRRSSEDPTNFCLTENPAHDLPILPEGATKTPGSLSDDAGSGCRVAGPGFSLHGEPLQVW